MRRLLFALILVLLAPAPSWASFTYRNSNENGGGGSATTVAVSVTSIGAGDLIVAACGNGSSATMSVSDGTTTLTALTLNANPTQNLQMFYLLSSVASGTVTYTCTYTPTAAAREIHVWAYTPSASPTLDTSRADGLSISGTAVSTGNITTTGTDELVVAAAYTGGARTGTTLLINGGAPDRSLNPGGHMQSWTKVFASTFTSDAAETLSPGTQWNANIAAFKIASAAVATPRGMLLGVGP